MAGLKTRAPWTRAPPYSRLGLTRRRAWKTCGDAPGQAVADRPVLDKHLFARAFRQGGVEGGPILRRQPQVRNHVERAVVGLGAQGHDQRKWAILAILEGVEALGPEGGEIHAQFVHDER